MGAYLSQPNTAKTSSDGGNSNMSYGFSAMQGWRVSMEVRRKINEQRQPTVFVCLLLERGRRLKKKKKMCPAFVNSDIKRMCSFSVHMCARIGVFPEYIQKVRHTPKLFLSLQHCSQSPTTCNFNWALQMTTSRDLMSHQTCCL